MTGTWGSHTYEYWLRRLVIDRSEGDPVGAALALAPLAKRYLTVKVPRIAVECGSHW
jgi:hypothetical protein